jgi:hypothetical protein
LLFSSGEFFVDIFDKLEFATIAHFFATTFLRFC